MQIIHQEFKKGIVKIQAENPDDLWYLNNIIEPGDIVKGSTWRKIKTGSEDERNKQTARKKMFIAITVEKVDFSKNASALKALGTIIEGPEDIPRGEHHSFTIEPETIITIIKKEWLGFQIDRLKQAAKEKQSSILICILDREEAFFALLRRAGYEIVSTIKGDVAKKADDEKSRPKENTFYSEVIKKLQDYSEKYKLQHIIVASPVFWKEELMKRLSDDSLKKKITLATCSSCDERAFNEVLKRPEVQGVFRDERAGKELALVEELFTEISTDNLACYGFDVCDNAVSAGAVKILLVSDSLIQKCRDDGTYARLEMIMKNAEKTKGEVHIISAENDAGKRLDGIGGIGAVLRYKLV